MASRTYIPSLRDQVQDMLVYIAKYQVKIIANGEVGTAEKISAVIACLNALLTVLPVVEPTE